jgi:hypothetical protein
MKRTRLLAVVAALGLAASVLGMANAGASTTTSTIASQIAQQLRSATAHHKVITIPLRLTAHASKARPDAASSCLTSAGIEACLRTTGTGPVLGSLLAGFRNINRGGFEAIDAITGPANFEISTYTGANPPPPVVGNGIGLNVGWLQNTPSATGYYRTGAFWYHGGVVTLVGPVVQIHVIA